MNYIISCSEKQFKTISLACEILARLQCGHLSAVFDQCKNEKGESFCIPYELTREVEKIIKPILGIELNAHYGVGKFDSADISWDIYQVIRHQIWDDRTDDKLDYTVDASPALKFGSEELIKVEKVSD